MSPAEYQKNRRDIRKSSGLCVDCGLKSRPNLNKCDICTKKRSTASTKWRQNNSDQFNASVREKYAKKKNFSICVRCNSPPELGKSLCYRCNKIQGKKTAKRYQECKLASICVNCSRPVINVALCELCIIKTRQYREKTWQKMLFMALKNRAKRNSIEINIEWSDIPDPNLSMCPVFGTKYTMGLKNKSEFSATVDRINPSLGYIKGNIQLLSSLANTIKSDADYLMIERIGKAVVYTESNLPSVLTDYDPTTRKRRSEMVYRRKIGNKNHNQLEFTIQWFNIEMPEFCPCTGIKIDYDSRKSSDWRNRPSIDRIDNSKGYTPNNIWVISMLANSIKSTATGSQILRVAKWLRNQI